MKKDHPDSRSRPAPFRISIPSLVEAGSREQAQVGRQPVPPTVLLPRSTPATTATAPPYAPSTNGKGPGRVEDGRGGGRLGEGGGGASLPQASVPWGRGQEAVFDAKHRGSMTLPILPPSHNLSAGVNVISVSPRQEGNPVLKKIKNVRYQFIPGIVPDYVLGAYTCCIFISLRYHLLHGQYLFQRVKELRR
ncbi:Restriction endonuclease, type II [Nannochloropsis gaditana]|uniref:Restriction endonuclease, type II n=1 Tax=Nannochloropsis gaditana TaxID=72520 RepID=W7TPV2_9STRA|nr:Restriction endonuclease, type II [Nannochloropsis gaditana]